MLLVPMALDLTGALGLERDGPSLGWRHQAAVSLCPSHMVAHPAFVVFFSGESFSPGPHPDPSLVWDKEMPAACKGLSALGVTVAPQKSRKSIPKPGHSTMTFSKSVSLGNT